MLPPRRSRSCFRDWCSQLVSACLPKVRNAECGARNDTGIGAQGNSAFRTLHSAFKMAARVGLAPTPHGLTGRRATLTLPGKGAAGRSSTCIVPLRRRMPEVFDHGSIRKWSERQDFHLRPPGPKPGALKTELRSEETGGPEGTCTLSPPADNGALCSLSYGSEMVGSAGNAPVVASG